MCVMLLMLLDSRAVCILHTRDSGAIRAGAALGTGSSNNVLRIFHLLSIKRGDLT